MLCCAERIAENTARLDHEKIVQIGRRMNVSARQVYMLLENRLLRPRVRSGWLKAKSEVIEASDLLEAGKWFCGVILNIGQLFKVVFYRPSNLVNYWAV